jgi:hypothetical protein
MKAQMDSNSRGHKDFICREFSFRKEKRKTTFWGMQGDPETGDPVGQGGEWGFIAFFVLPGGRDVSQVQTEVSWEGVVKCLLDHLSPFGTSCSLSFSPS